MTYTCPKDPTHASDDPDYCSVCGAKIGGSGVGGPPASTTAGFLGGVGLGPVGAPLTAPSSVSASPDSAVGEVCPDCGTVRVGTARFCEVCRHDFQTGTAAPTAPVDPPILPSPAPPELRAAEILAPSLEVVAVADASLYVDPDPAIPFPDGEPERTFPLDLAENLIGRRSDKQDIHPEIPLADTGVSHRHAKLLREPDGSFVLLDVGSSNGTQLNGKDVPAGVRTPIKAGDEITLGCWTRLTLREVGGRP